MNWQPLLLPEETLRWQGRPAPRCWTFRNWRHSLFGMLLLPFSVWWQGTGLSLGREYANVWLILLPLPVLLFALYLAFGHLLLARLEWEKVFFAVTDRRILLRRGVRGQVLLSLPLDEVGAYRLVPQGECLGTVKIRARGGEERLTLSCIEYPQGVTALLDAVLAEAEAMPQRVAPAG